MQSQNFGKDSLSCGLREDCGFSTLRAAEELLEAKAQKWIKILEKIPCPADSEKDCGFSTLRGAEDLLEARVQKSMQGMGLAKPSPIWESFKHTSRDNDKGTPM